jgi:ribosomal protein L14
MRGPVEAAMGAQIPPGRRRKAGVGPAVVEAHIQVMVFSPSDPASCIHIHGVPVLPHGEGIPAAVAVVVWEGEFRIIPNRRSPATQHVRSLNAIVARTDLEVGRSQGRQRLQFADPAAVGFGFQQQVSGFRGMPVVAQTAQPDSGVVIIACAVAEFTLRPGLKASENPQPGMFVYLPALPDFADEGIEVAAA